MATKGFGALRAAPSSGNSAFAITLEEAEPGRPAALGIEANSWMSAIPLPLNLDGLYGAGSGCNLQTGLDIVTGWPTGIGSTSFPAPIPPGLARAP